jgi:hypothetical protein
MRTKRSQEGYLQIDHRAGDGTRLVPAGTQLEVATLTCAHCHTIYVLNPQRTRERGWCWKCDQYLCDKPGCNAGCHPVNKLFDKIQEAAGRGLRVTPGGIILPET